MRKRPRDPNQLAKLIVDIAVGDVVDEEPQPEGRARSGHARAASMSAERRAEIARKAAAARWGTPAPQVLRERGPDETAPPG